MRVYSDDFKKIYDPSYNENEKWYINDHCIIKGDDGWHLYGITHTEPEVPLEEILCAHAMTNDILAVPFSKRDYPFSAEKEAGEMHFWAPHVIKHEGLYYMFYCAGSLDEHEKYRIHLATSEDLYNWKRHPENPLVVDGFDARDPMVLRIGDKWVMYYTCTSETSGGKHCVAAVVSDDLIHWSDKRYVYTSDITGTYGGPCESPFVERINGTYFLFIGPYGGYDKSYCDTAVYRSDDPFEFREENLVGHINAHGAEVIKTKDEYYITHCGWGQDGVYIAPLHFDF